MTNILPERVIEYEGKHYRLVTMEEFFDVTLRHMFRLINGEWWIRTSAYATRMN